MVWMISFGNPLAFQWSSLKIRSYALRLELAVRLRTHPTEAC